MMHLRAFTYEPSFMEMEYSNTFILFDDEKHAIIIDPGKKYDGIVDFLLEKKLNPLAILLTHGHCDHIEGIENILNRYKNTKVYMHFEDFDYLSEPKLNLSKMLSGEGFSLKITPEFVKDGEELVFFEQYPIRIIHTPYHTPGSICFYFYKNNIIFTGDSLFKDGVGNTSFPRSNKKIMQSSLEKLFALPEETIVYPGHGPKTTIGREKAVNL